jgi:hypothetical protein
MDLGMTSRTCRIDLEGNKHMEETYLDLDCTKNAATRKGTSKTANIN